MSSDRQLWNKANVGWAVVLPTGKILSTDYTGRGFKTPCGVGLRKKLLLSLADRHGGRVVKVRVSVVIERMDLAESGAK
jgi:hypothetical protein